MRHRITSFRYVETKSNMSPRGLERKTCNANQIRQSSIVRAASGQAGITKASAPVITTAMRPRLNAIASSKGSRAASSRRTRDDAASNRAPSERDASVVQMKRPGALVALAREIITRRVAFEHSSAKRAVPVESMNRAALPPGTAWYVQVPGVTRAVA